MHIHDVVTRYNNCAFQLPDADAKVNAGANQLFASCSVSRPATCPASPLGVLVTWWQL